MMNSLLKPKKHCQICMKSFANGKALGGHMKSHFQKLPVPCRETKPAADSSTGSTIPLLQTSEKLGANPSTPCETVLIRSVHSSEVVASPKSDLSKEDGHQLAGKRRVFVDLDKDVQTAFCLGAHELDDEESYYKYLDKDDDDIVRMRTPTANKEEDTSTGEDDARACFVSKERKCKKLNSEYVCDLCGKVFLSYQALGGHRTAHTYKRTKVSDEAVNPKNGAVVRRHECQLCGKVFESGQALGGHKKAHFLFLKPVNK